jgi:16S rRNA (adenine1518-N6/adenine1519-N6)-dimethyltransferase
MVKAGSFVPRPKVDSAIIAIEEISKEFFQEFSEEKFFALLRAGFSSKRKKLSSNLANIFDKEKVTEAFKKLNLDENIRAEDVNIAIWQKLAMLLL